MSGLIVICRIDLTTHHRLFKLTVPLYNDDTSGLSIKRKTPEI